MAHSEIEYRISSEIRPRSPRILPPSAYRVTGAAGRSGRLQSPFVVSTSASSAQALSNHRGAFDKLRRASGRTASVVVHGAGDCMPAFAGMTVLCCRVAVTGVVSGPGLWSRWVGPGGPVRAGAPRYSARSFAWRPLRFLRGDAVFVCVFGGEFLVSSCWFLVGGLQGTPLWERQTRCVRTLR